MNSIPPVCAQSDIQLGASTFDLGVIVPVREGSSRIKDKVLLPFAENLTLLEWKLVQLREVVPPDRIYVSTDSDHLKALARGQGVNIHHRDARLCRGHEATFSEIITGVVEGIPHKHIAWVTVVVPLMGPEDYDGAFHAYRSEVIEKAEHDSLFSANLMKEYLWNEGAPLNYQADRNHTISQHLPDIYRVTNGLYMRDRESILREGYFLGKNPAKYLVSKTAGIDIDVIEDFEIARSLRGMYHQRLMLAAS